VTIESWSHTQVEAYLDVLDLQRREAAQDDPRVSARERAARSRARRRHKRREIDQARSLA
jgi:hypothetical protein